MLLELTNVLLYMLLPNIVSFVKELSSGAFYFSDFYYLGLLVETTGSACFLKMFAGLLPKISVEVRGF